jgi:hypothetical protein
MKKFDGDQLAEQLAVQMPEQLPAQLSIQILDPLDDSQH